MPASEAEKKFWNCPELVEKMLLVLDLKSLALLLEAHKPLIDNQRGHFHLEQADQVDCVWVGQGERLQVEANQERV